MAPVVGQRFGRLVLSDPGEPRKGGRIVRATCDCGKSWDGWWQNLKQGRTVSCGCLNKEMAPARRRTHGATSNGRKTPEYRAWCSMIERVTRVTSPDYKDYGGRGIAVCDRWYVSFENFLADMGSKPSPSHSIDRYPDTNGNYEPGNCRWATSTEQARNKRTTRMVNYQGRNMSLAEACTMTSVKYHTALARLRKGWDTRRALEEPTHA